MAKNPVEVKQDPLNPIKDTILAEAIVRVSKAAAQLNASGLNRRAIIVLIHDALPSGRNRPGMTAIRAILDAMEELEGRYCVKKKKGKK